MNFKALDEFMRTMPERGFPASEIAVTVKGELVYRKSVGYADSSKTKPCTKNDLYWLFSATKVITCLAALKLVEDGKIKLDDELSKYMPAYKNMKIKHKDGTLTDAAKPILIEHLFAMTAGMGYSLTTPAVVEAAERCASTVDTVSAMATEPLYFEPGTHYKYCLSHDVLAALIEVVSGMRYSEYLKKVFFEPLGIVDMGFNPTFEQLERFSAMYKYKTGLSRAVEVENKNVYRLSENYESGGAGLFGSVDEYIKIITMAACGGKAPSGKQILKPETIKLCMVNRLCEDALDDFVVQKFYGYGWGLCGRVHTNPTVSLSRSPVGEFGWDGAAGAFAMIDPVNEVAFFFGTNVLSCTYVYNIIHPTLRNLVYECIGD